MVTKKREAAVKGETVGKARVAKRRVDIKELAEPKPKLTDIAYERLEEAIITLKLPPGSIVSELTLSQMFDIGRTPIREAIQRLAREHLMLVLPQRGLLIPEIDLPKQLRLIETRREVERLICRSAARRATREQREQFMVLHDAFLEAAAQDDEVSFIRADRQFNELEIEAARNEFAEGAMRLMHGLSRRFWFCHYQQDSVLSEMGRLHAEVAAAIAGGDMNQAGQSLDRLMDHIEQLARSTLISSL
ncbi:MAG: GntR family transcriptional regulator [Alcaligenes sp.]